MKVNITIDKDWLEATWIEDEIQVHCESFSGHNVVGVKITNTTGSVLSDAIILTYVILKGANS